MGRAEAVSAEKVSLTRGALRLPFKTPPQLETPKLRDTPPHIAGASNRQERRLSVLMAKYARIF